MPDWAAVALSDRNGSDGLRDHAAGESDYGPRPNQARVRRDSSFAMLLQTGQARPECVAIAAPPTGHFYAFMRSLPVLLPSGADCIILPSALGGNFLCGRRLSLLLSVAIAAGCAKDADQVGRSSMKITPARGW
jgi:hypothetical protein